MVGKLDETGGVFIPNPRIESGTSVIGSESLLL